AIDQQAGESQSQVVEAGPQFHRALEFANRLSDCTSLGVHLAQARVLVRQSCGDGGREAGDSGALRTASRIECLHRLLVATELVEHQAALDLRLDVARIEPARLVQFRERLLGALQHRQAETAEVMHVGLLPRLPDTLPRAEPRALVVLRRDPLAGRPEQVTYAHPHWRPSRKCATVAAMPPRNSTAGCHPSVARARVMSGRRTLGSSPGRGLCTTP